MKKIGLTGGIATGKSTSVKILIDNGFNVIDSDKIVKKILNEDDEVLYYIKNEFGDKYLFNNKILVKEFGEYIFSHKDEKCKYENFIMPKIFKEIENQFSYHENNKESLCILDAPLLIEKNLHLFMDYVILIWANKEQQVSRLMERDNLNRESALKRVNSQIDIDVKKKFANFIIDNSKDFKFLENQINKICMFLNTL